MTISPARARVVLAAPVALLVAATAALVAHEPAGRRTVHLAQSQPSETAAASNATTTTVAPTTTSTTNPPPTTVITAPPTTAAPLTTAAAPSTTIRPRIPRQRPPVVYVTCQFVDQGNWLGQQQRLAVSAPDLAGRRIMLAYYFPAEGQTSIGSRYTDLDANGNGSIGFATTPEMVGQSVRLEAWEMMLGPNENQADARHCSSTTFTIPPPS